MSASSLDSFKASRTQAAYWLNQRRSGDMTAHDERAFQVWLDRAAGNRSAYTALEQRWDMLGSIAQDPEILASRDRDARRFDRPAHLRIAGAVAASLVLAVTAGWSLVSSGALQEIGVLKPAPAQIFQTSVGQRATVTLPDGSVVTLDTDTVMKLHETRTQRHVALDRGRAYFRVAKDPSRPFIVAVDDKTVRAIGTAFDVRRDTAGITVTLAEGKVRVEQPRDHFRRARQIDMVAGAQLVARDDSVWKVREVDMRQEMSWVDGRLTFFQDPLKDALEEMNRYSDRKLVFRGDQIPNKRIFGVFRAGDVESFAKALELNKIARVIVSNEERIELAPPYPGRVITAGVEPRGAQHAR